MMIYTDGHTRAETKKNNSNNDVQYTNIVYLYTLH